MLKTFEIKLDIENELYNPSNILFSVSRNDLESIELQFEITQDNAAMDLTGTTVELAIKKPSGLVVYQECEITDAAAGKAAARLSIQAYVEYGVHTAEVYVRNVEQMAITSPFYFMSREAIMETEEIESVNDWSALQQALFSMDKKPILVDGVPTTIPEYVGQMAFDITGKRAFIANDVTETGWQLLAAGEGGGGGIVYWTDILNKPSAFTPEIHTHDFVDITGKPATYPPDNHMHNMAAIDGLETALAGKADDADLVPFITESEADLKYAAKGETGGGTTGAAWGEITGTLANQTDLQTALNGKADDADLAAKADAAHTHAFADITAKPATYPPDVHTHAFADITAKPAAYPPEAHNHLWADITDKPTTFTPPAEYLTQTEGDNRYTLKGSEGGTVQPAEWGQITGDIALQTDLQNALAGKADDADLAAKADATHTHAFADITAKPATYPAEAHNHAIAEITGLDAALAGKADDADLAAKADAVHTHAFADITAKPATYPPEAHNHAIAEVTGLDAALAGKADDADLAAKADAVHSHAFADITAKPATYPPDVHTHAFADITGKPATYPAEAHQHVAADITDFGTAVAANIPAEYLTETEGDGRYLSAVPAEYLTETEGDGRYQAAGTVPAHTHTEADLTFGAKNAKTYVDDADNYILNTRMAGLTLWKGTQAAYDAIATKDPNTLYFITG